MKKQIALPEEILQLFKLIPALPNSNANQRPALTNTLLLNHHPASCRAIKDIDTQHIFTA